MQILIEKVWVYAVEVIAAGLICVVLWIWKDPQGIAQWQVEKRADLLVFTAGAIAVSAAVFAAYFALLTTDFGKKLRVHGAAAEYASAFAFPLVLFSVATAMLEFLSKNSDPSLSRVVTFLLCYSGLNCVTMVRNVIGLVRLWQDVERSEQKGGGS